MNEENRNKREWVKSAAIVFLVIMLILTFFSNTFLNYSLPQVATQRIQSGTITAKIRGTGIVESGEPYNVEVKQSRKVSGVAVAAGLEVEKGDVLFYLEDEESEELNIAVKTLESLEDDFDKYLLTSDIDKTMANDAKNGKTVSVADYQNKITAAKNAVDLAQKDVDDAQAWVTALGNQISISSSITVNTAKEEKELNEAKTKLTNAKIVYGAAENTYNTVSGGDAATVADAQKALDDAAKAVAECEQKVNTCTIALNTAQIKVDNAETDSKTTVANLQAQLANANNNLSVFQKKLSEKKTAYDELISNINTEYDLVARVQTIQEQREVVNKLREESVDATIKAPIAGTITSVNVVAGGSTAVGVPVVVIQPAGKGYTLSFSVTNEQANKVSVGDPAELVNSWWYNDIKATVADKKPDVTDPSKKKILTFNLAGELTAGQSLSLSVGQKSANYDMIVPNSAIREDNNGKFILIIQQKSSPLGNRFIATRADIEVLASDDTQSAIKGSVYGYEDVITTSTKPVDAKQQVRLAD